MDNDEKRKIRRYIREWIEQRNMSDETLHKVVCVCANNGWVEELKLAVNVPRSSVECFYIFLLIMSVVHFWLLFI